MEPREAGIDRLLRSSLAAPVPALPPDFEQRVMRELHQGSEASGRHRRILLTGYGLVSVITSAVVMRGQGLGWEPISVMILLPLALVAAVPWVRDALSATSKAKPSK